MNASPIAVGKASALLDASRKAEALPTDLDASRKAEALPTDLDASRKAEALPTAHRQM
jgi:hypothetical protein